MMIPFLRPSPLVPPFLYLPYLLPIVHSATSRTNPPTFAVLARILHPNRRSGMVKITTQRLRRARDVCGLVAADLQLAGHADHQLGGKGALVGRLVLVQRLGRRVEGARRAVSRFCGAGGWYGGGCDCVRA